MRTQRSDGTAWFRPGGAATRVTLAILVAGMALTGAPQGPATAATTAAAQAAIAPAAVTRNDSLMQPSPGETAATSVLEATVAEAAAVTATSTTETTSTPPAAAAAAAPATPTVAVVPAAPVAAAAAAPFSCAVAFCYPRLGISGGIAPYSDCTGHTDVGTQIVQLNCTTPTYLMGHAYTQFGRIVNWRAGDQVWVHGDVYTVYGAVVTHCGAWPPPAGGPLRMQTSLSSGCGDVLVVLAR